MKSNMRERREIVLNITRMLAAVLALPAAAAAQDASQKAARKKENMAAGENEAKKLLLLMDRDQNGKVSKQEFMSFMETEFDRLDKDKNGELDVQELTRSRVRTSGVHR